MILAFNYLPAHEEPASVRNRVTAIIDCKLVFSEDVPSPQAALDKAHELATLHNESEVTCMFFPAQRQYRPFRV